MSDSISKLRTAFKLIEEVLAELDEPSQVKVTFAEVRAVLAAKAGKGFANEVMALIRSHNVDKLSEIPESEYATVLKEAEAIGNAD